MEAEASTAAAAAAAGLSVRDEADRLLAEHRDKTKELREAMKVRCYLHPLQLLPAEVHLGAESIGTLYTSTIR